MVMNLPRIDTGPDPLQRSPPSLSRLGPYDWPRSTRDQGKEVLTGAIAVGHEKSKPVAWSARATPQADLHLAGDLGFPGRRAGNGPDALGWPAASTH
jgi:hypothetical protein